VRVLSGEVMPRVAAIADQFIQSANLEFSDTGFAAFVGSFQEHSPLQMAELWALVPALKLSLLEQIAHRSPELLEDQARRFPAVLFTRGARDEWLTQPRFDRDVTALSGRSIALTTRVYDGAHEWNGEVSEAIGEFLKTLPSRYS